MKINLFKEWEYRQYKYYYDRFVGDAVACQNSLTP